MTYTEEPASPYPDIRTLLAATESKGRFVNNGAAHAVYRFSKDSGLDGYVLRIRNHVPQFDDIPEFKTLLSQSSSLVPVPLLVKDLSIGQPLMMLDDKKHGHYFTILPYVPGISLLKVKDDILKKCDRREDLNKARAEAAIKISDLLLKAMAQHPDDNIFEPILRDVYVLGRSHRGGDFTNNILLDRKRGVLHLVDQFEETDASKLPQENHAFALQVVRMAVRQFNHDIFSTDVLRYCKEHHRDELPKIVYIRTMLRIAAEHIDKNPPRAEGIAFADTSSVHAVSLDSPPRDLKTTLDQLRQQAIPSL